MSSKLSLIPRSTVVAGLVALGVALAGAPAQASAASPSEASVSPVPSKVEPDRLKDHVAKGPTSFEMDIMWVS